MAPPRSDTFNSRENLSIGGSGMYNSQRGLVPPRSTSFSPRNNGSINTSQPPPMTFAGPSSRKAMEDPFLRKVVVLVDDATEPGTTDEEGKKYREELIKIVHEKSSLSADISTRTSHVTGGQAVAYALRKRLKSDDEIAVLNTLTLLDELMRTCPYFFRFIANEKFFRRMWRFVVPHYKNGVKSMIPLLSKGKVHAGMRQGSEATERVLILIRAWANELSEMFKGQYDADAGFLIERYNNKKLRVNFPEIPETATPWIYPVRRPGAGNNWRGGSASGRGRDEELKMTLAEVENTVSLFENIVENANTVSDLKEELCMELAEKCTQVKNNLSRMSMNMSEEEELARAIAISETLERTLALFNNSIENGHLIRSAPIIDSGSLQSEDEGYDDVTHGASSRSLDRYGAPRVSYEREDSRGEVQPREPERSSRRYSESSELSSGGREDWAERGHERNRERYSERNRERDSERNRERAPERNRERDPERNRERDRDRERDRSYRSREEDERPYRSQDIERPHRSQERSYSPVPLQRESTNDKRRPVKISSSDKRTRRSSPKSGLRRRQKSDSDLLSLEKESKKKNTALTKKKKSGLIELPDSKGDDDSEEEMDQGKEAAFTMLAERYSQHIVSRKSKPKPSGSKSRSAAVVSADTSSSDQSIDSQSTKIAGANATTVPQLTSAPGNPAAMYQSTPGMVYNPMMMMPNPYSMYGSVSHMAMPDPMAMYNAYQTVNPAMYYASMNPGLFPSQPMQMMPGMQAPGVQNSSVPQNPAIQGTPLQQSPSVRSVSHQSPQQSIMPQMTPQQGQVQNAVMLTPGPLTQAGSGGQADAPQQVPMSPQGAPLSTTMQPQMSSFYGSFSGQNPMMSQPAGMPYMAPQNGISQISSGDMSGMQSQMQTSDAGAQAAVYQNAMQQAAMAYHTAANAYRTIQGQTPIEASVNPLPAPANAVPEQNLTQQAEGQ